MKRLWISILFILCSQIAQAATYYVNQSGSGDADGSSYANSMSVETHNAATFAGDDVIRLCDTITSSIIVPSSGTEGHPIVYDEDADHPCTITGFTTASSWTGPDGNGEYYVTASQTPRIVLRDWVDVTRGSAQGSLNADEWAWYSASARIYYKPPAGHTPNEYTIKYVTATTPRLLINNQDYIDVKNITFEGDLSTALTETAGSVVQVNDSDYINLSDSIIQWGYLSGLTFYGCDNYIIDNVTISECGANGVQNYGACTYGTISDSTIFDIGTWAWDSRGYIDGVDIEGISLSGATGTGSHMTITRNTIHDIGKTASTSNCAGIYLYTYNDSEISRNKIYNCAKSGIIAVDGASGSNLRNKIHGNFVYNGGTSTDDTRAPKAGIYIGNNNGSGCDDTVVAGNTVYNWSATSAYLNKFGAYVLYKDFAAANDAPLTFENNLASNGAAPALHVITNTNPFSALTIDYNLWHNTSGSLVIWNASTYTLAQWETYLSEQSKDANSPAPGDPKFYNPALHDFRVHSDGAGVEKGTDLGSTYQRDYYGHWQGDNGAAWDIGTIWFDHKPTIQ